jgi:hypothetical protein
VPMEARKPRLLQALNELYPERTAEIHRHADHKVQAVPLIPAAERAPRVPWLHSPEDSWL